MSNKLLVICGPTATGKTSLGFKLAEELNGEIVSADSRQVYKYMDIGTGKEWSNKIKVWGYDLVQPTDSFSVSDYFREMKFAVDNIWHSNKLPIIVGGTGLYIKSLVEGIATVDIPKNESLRMELEKMAIDEQFEKLAALDGTKAASMNSSDKKNPRRLVRAIEVAMWNIGNSSQKKVIAKRINVLPKDTDILQIGLTSSQETLLLNVKKRVDKRMNDGFIDEVESLLKMGVSWKHQSMKSLGYAESELFFKEGLTYEEFIEIWERNEMKYIKRQLTWFKKNKNINWFDVTDINYPGNVEKMVHKWYSSSSHAKKS